MGSYSLVPSLRLPHIHKPHMSNFELRNQCTTCEAVSAKLGFRNPLSPLLMPQNSVPLFGEHLGTMFRSLISRVVCGTHCTTLCLHKVIPKGPIQDERSSLGS